MQPWMLDCHVNRKAPSTCQALVRSSCCCSPLFRPSSACRQTAAAIPRQGTSAMTIGPIHTLRNDSQSKTRLGRRHHRYQLSLPDTLQPSLPPKSRVFHASPAFSNTQDTLFGTSLDVPFSLLFLLKPLRTSRREFRVDESDAAAAALSPEIGRSCNQRLNVIRSASFLASQV